MRAGRPGKGLQNLLDGFNSRSRLIAIKGPGWRNGLRRGLKILDPNGFVGSNPTPGILHRGTIFIMKRTIYILAFTFLGFLLQFLIHAWIEIWYTGLLASNFLVYGFGLSWSQWYLIHHILTTVLLIAGVGFGYFQGRYWWNQIYILKRWKKT